MNDVALAASGHGRRAAKLKEEAGLRERLQGAADLAAAVAMAQEAGFDVSKADLLGYQARQTLELSNEELNGVAGGCNPLLPLNNAANIIGKIALLASA